MTETERARSGRPAWFTTAIITVVVLGPLLGHGGFALRGDMVFVPDQPWKPAWLGLDGSVPRAVPMDGLISWADEIVPGALLQRVLLVGAFLLGGVGIGRLTRGFRAPGQVAAVVVFLWNPWLYERLSIGQWPTVLAYGLLPWLVLGATRARESRPRGWGATALVLVLTAACAPSMGLVGAMVAASVIAVGGRLRPVLAVLGLALLANLPWLVPALLGPGLAADPDQFTDFAARGESSLGTFASLLSTGGIWKSSIVPPERTHVVVVGVAALLALAFLVGLRHAVPVLGRRTTAGLAVAGALSFLIALLPSFGPIGDALGSLSSHWPALGILRDSHRYLAPAALVLAVGAAALVDALWARARDDAPALVAVALLVAVTPVVLLPSLVWGLAGAVRPADYPEDWSRVAEKVSAGGGATVVLPWTGSYRGYAWNDHRAVLDPAPRYLPGDVLVDDRVFLRTRVVAGEDAYLGRVREALGHPDSADRLRALGVRWVLVEKANGVQPSAVPAGRTAVDSTWLTLVDLGPVTEDLRHWRPTASAWIVVLGDVMTVLLVCVSIWHTSGRSARTRQ